MDGVSLMKRQDTKFVLRTDQLQEILSELADSYKVLQVGGNRLMTYDSTYFDTSDLLFYHQHHNGIARRIKVRIRNYVESKISFLEVKQKDNKGNTNKTRIPVDEYVPTLNEIGEAFVNKTVKQKINLKKSISNRFNRFTLVNTERQERVTFDLNLGYNGDIYDKNLTIIELKQEKLDRTSVLFKALHNRKIHPYSISKYCVGMAALNKDIKQNNFKHKLLTINKLTA